MLLTWKQNSGAFLNILFSFDPRGRGAGGGLAGGGIMVYAARFRPKGVPF